MKDFSRLFAAELAQTEQQTQLLKAPAPATNLRKASALKVGTPGSVLQLNATPFALDLNTYANAHSADNPTGSYLAAYRFSRLADPVPATGSYYLPGLNSTEKIWNNIVRFADADSAYGIMLLDENREVMGSSKLSGMGGVPEDWYPVYANPSNWYDIVKIPGRLMRMDIDVEEGDTDTKNYRVSEGNVALDTLTWNNGRSSTGLSPASAISKVTVDVLRVDFIRPWLHFELLNLGGWKIGGLKQGYYSNGQLDNNSGIFPLVVKSMLVGARVSMQGNLQPAEVQLISSVTADNKALSIGPFLVDSVAKSDDDASPFTLSANVTQVIGYISQLVPMAPAS